MEKAREIWIFFAHKFHCGSQIFSVIIRANSWDLISSPTTLTNLHGFLNFQFSTFNFQFFSFSDFQFLRFGRSGYRRQAS